LAEETALLRRTAAKHSDAEPDLQPPPPRQVVSVLHGARALRLDVGNIRIRTLPRRRAGLGDVERPARRVVIVAGNGQTFVRLERGNRTYGTRAPHAVGRADFSKAELAQAALNPPDLVARQRLLGRRGAPLGGDEAPAPPLMGVGEPGVVAVLRVACAVVDARDMRPFVRVERRDEMRRVELADEAIDLPVE